MSATATDRDFYRTLVESTKAIPWMIDWPTLSFTYIGPQIEPLLGWSADSWQSVNDWADRMHPEDRDWVVNYCVTQSKEGQDHEADYRALHRDGHYVWIRDVVHVIRDEAGEAQSLVGFMFDISERKKIEDKLVQLQKELETLSYQDGLTGVANRRMFDKILEREWHDAARQGRPLSLILVDIDDFKHYNDHLGHIQGDDCLRRVARVLDATPHRPRDFVARYGGEEFALILPGADANAARQIAERCRRRLAELAIEHPQSRAGCYVTLSQGVATINPSPRHQPVDLIRRADQCLYAAKAGGRDTIVCEPDPALEAPPE